MYLNMFSFELKQHSNTNSYNLLYHVGCCGVNLCSCLGSRRHSLCTYSFGHLDCTSVHVHIKSNDVKEEDWCNSGGKILQIISYNLYSDYVFKNLILIVKNWSNNICCYIYLIY